VSYAPGVGDSALGIVIVASSSAGWETRSSLDGRSQVSDERDREFSTSGEQVGCSASKGSVDRSADAARVADRAPAGGDYRRVYVAHYRRLDVTPKHSDGRIIAAVVMLTRIGFLAVITASVAASLAERSRRRLFESEGDLARRLDEVSERLVRIEASLAARAPSGSSDGVS
jgi:hypothetical protein